MKRWPYKRGVLSWRDNLIVFYCLNASEFWSDKKEGHWWEGSFKRRTIYCITILQASDRIVDVPHIAHSTGYFEISVTFINEAIHWCSLLLSDNCHLWLTFLFNISGRATMTSNCRQTFIQTDWLIDHQYPEH